MSKFILGFLMLAVFSTANATSKHHTPKPTPPKDCTPDCLYISGAKKVTFSHYDGEPAKVTGTKSSGYTGTLATKEAGVFTATYLGNESAYVDSFTFGGKTLHETDPLGTSISAYVSSAGALQFSFSDSLGKTFANGSKSSSVMGFVILDGAIKSKYEAQYGKFEYLLGFNDSFKGDTDYDDFVVGVNFKCGPVASVPEPETYAMMLAGLGLVGFAARRRRNK